MKSILITLSLFALCATSSTFLRNLESKGAIASFTFTCNKGLTLPNTFKATTTTDGRPTAKTDAVTILHLDGVAAETTTNDLKYTCAFPAQSSSRLRNLAAYEATCTKDSAAAGTAAYGTYKVVSMTVAPSDEITFSSATGNSWEFVEDFALADSQTTSQEVDSESDDKKTFTIALKAAMTGTVAPKIYTNATETAKEVPCALDTEKKKIVCTPTTTQMESGKDYTVQYKKPCETSFTSTGITVKFSASYFLTVSKVLLVLALLF